MKITPLVVLLIAASSLAAPNESVLKVTSYPCATPEKVRHGSGTAFSKDGKLYLVTSSHVLFHGDANERICHRTSDPSGAGVTARLLRVNVARGAALLQLPDNVSLAVRPLEWRALADEVPVSETDAELTGFAWESKTRSSDSSARILDARSTRGILPLVKTIFEVKGHSEYGMSGGSLLTAKGSYVGMLSHQYLRVISGEVSEPQSYRRGERVNDSEMIALVIPRSEVAAWIVSALREQAGSDLRERVADQLRGDSAIALSGLVFLEQAPPEGNTLAQGRRTTSGGDGVGVGGDGRRGSRAGVTVTVSLDSGQGQAWPFRDQRWIEQAKADLRLHSTITFIGLRKDSERHVIPDLLTFFTRLEQGYSPVWRRTSRLENLDGVAKELVNTAQDLQKALNEIASPREAATLRRRLAYCAELVTLGQWEELSVRELSALITPAAESQEKQGWTALYRMDFDKAVAMKRLLIRIEDAIGRLNGGLEK